MRSGIAAAVAATALVIHAEAQAPRLAPAPVQRVAVATAASAAAASPGDRLTLWVDVVPNAGIHVYGAGATGFTPVALTLVAGGGVVPAAAVYPPPVLVATVGTLAPVPAYRAPFRIAQPVRIGRSAVPGSTLTLRGALTYQACDDVLCYPAASVPVSWSIPVTAAAGQRRRR